MEGQSIEDGSAMSFACRILRGLPPTGPTPYQFKAQHQRTHGEGLVVRVKMPDGSCWVGNFQPGESHLSGVFDHPSADVLCVVAGGQGYLVPVNRPSDYELVVAVPITQVSPIPARHLIVFADYTKLVAYGPNGIVWTSERLSWDGLEIAQVLKHQMIVKARDLAGETETRVAVDLESGQSHVVGSE